MVVGGGPAGSVAARLLAAWGHRVRLLTRPVDTRRALANSLPPSTHKLLAQTGIAAIVDRIGFRTTGNTVWWADRAGSVEPFSADASMWGYQVDRARLDAELLLAAAAAGVSIQHDARVQRVHLDENGATAHYETPRGPRQCRARILIDASGRAGVVAVAHRLREHVPGGRMQALVGVWEQPGGWFLQDPTHTFIETCDEGWAWSIPTDLAVRHVGVMVDGATSRVTRGRSLEETYRTQLGLTPRIHRQVRDSRLTRVFACDASVYTASRHAGPAFILAGDAGSTLNPLSSFGVKKALASAWLAAVAARTMLLHPARAEAAREFYSCWASQVWHVNLARSREFATEAMRRHRSPFWSTQAAAIVDEAQLPVDEAALLSGADVRAALANLRDAHTIVFSTPAEGTLVSAPIVRGNVIVVEDAVTLGPERRDIVRYVRGIDLVVVARLASSCPDVPSLFQHYCARCGVSALPDFLAALSVLLARRVLVAQAVREPARA